MSRKRLGRLQRAATIVPLALLSAAWTASVAGIGGVAAPLTASEQGALPDGSSVPEEAIEAPASLTDSNALGDNGNTAGIVNATSTNEIPSAALAAYQRAETVINSADKKCKLAWQLVAAIGRVESNHGRFGGNVLDDDGVARPGIYGIPLNGKKNTASISDTDAGQIDNDTKWDRAVGPMQFIPSTWSVVGVDADADSERNPQDIDDSALATAVYLCSGKDDLSEVMGQRAAVYRYNHSQSYVDLVLEIMNAYLEGDFTSVPNNTTAAGYVVPDTNDYPGGGSTPGGGDNGDGGGNGGADDNTGGNDLGDTGGGDDGGGDNGGGDNGGDGGGDGGGGNDPGDLTNPGGNNAPDTNTPLDDPVEDLIDGLLGPVHSLAEARQKCSAKYPSALQTVDFLACLASYGL